MKNQEPLSEQRLTQAFVDTPRGELGADFGRRVLAELDRRPRSRGTFSRPALVVGWVLIAAAAVAVLATVQWRSIEPDLIVATVVGGSLLLCLGALSFLLRIAGARFMDLFWRALLD